MWCDGNNRLAQSDGLDREAGLLASAEVSDVSSEGGQVEAPLAVTVASTGEDAEADSCGYEGDVGESTKLPPSLRRPADVVVVAPTGQVSSKVTIGHNHEVHVRVLSVFKYYCDTICSWSRLSHKLHPYTS